MALTDIIETSRRVMTLFFVIDTSGSMGGAKIGSVNTAIKEVIPIIKDLSDENPDAEIKIAALEFSSGARWITANPMALDQFTWNNLDADGTTDLGDACKALNEKLSTKAFMKEATGSFAPAIFLMSDGDPTDDWQKSLAALKANNWFKASVRVALAIGEQANKDVLKEFTGNMETVIEVNNTATLKRMIKFASVTASKIASTSSNVSEPGADPVDGDEARNIQLGKDIKAEEDIIAHEPPPATDDGEVW